MDKYFQNEKKLKIRHVFNSELLEPHYSTQIYKGYLTYLENTLGLEYAKEIVEKCGLNWEYLKKESNWVSEKFAEKFYDVLTSDKNVPSDFSYEAGKLAMSKEQLGGAQLLAMQVMDPILVYKQISYFGGKLNKVDKVEVIEFTKNSITIQLTSNRTTNHFDQFIQNWIGFLEQIPVLFDYEKAKSELITSTSKTAKISFSWNAQFNTTKYRKMRAYSFLGTIVMISSVSLMQKNQLSDFMSGASAISGFIYFYAFLYLYRFKRKINYNGRKKINSLLQEAEERYKDLFEKQKDLDKKYKESKILSDVLSRINLSNKNSKELVKITVKEIKETLNYDRVLYMGIDELTNSLKTEEVLGFDGKAKDILINYKIDLNITTDNEIHLGNIFKNKKKVLVPVTNTYFNTLSDEGKALFVFVKSKSFLAVPVYTQNMSFGVLLVDYYITPRILTEDDLNFIQSVANQLAISMENTKNFEKEIKIRNAFQKFVPDQVVKAMLGESELDLEKGIETNGTILFSDLRGFSKNSLLLGSEFMVKVMNYYFREMSSIVYGNNGIIERLMGDGLLAIFNPFNDDINHAQNALLTAEKMLLKLNEINLEISKLVSNENKTWNPFELGIALHSGQFILGNIGTDGKTEFTSFGETVNSTARICEVSKGYGNCIIYSKELLKQVQVQIPKSLGELQLRGTDLKKELFIIQHTLKNNKEAA